MLPLPAGHQACPCYHVSYPDKIFYLGLPLGFCLAEVGVAQQEYQNARLFPRVLSSPGLILIFGPSNVQGKKGQGGAIFIHGGGLNSTMQGADPEGGHALLDLAAANIMGRGQAQRAATLNPDDHG
jgi:hypothetical protein